MLITVSINCMTLTHCFNLRVIKGNNQEVKAGFRVNKELSIVLYQSSLRL